MFEPAAKAAFREDESSPQRFRANTAKRNWRQAFDNKGNREIADFSAFNDSRGLRGRKRNVAFRTAKRGFRALKQKEARESCAKERSSS